MSNHHISELPAPCPCCGGDGGWDDYEMNWTECSACNGTGEVQTESVTLEDLTDETRNDPHSFYDWQRKQNEGAPLRAWAPPKPAYEADDGYNAAQGPKFNPNGWGKS